MGLINEKRAKRFTWYRELMNTSRELFLLLILLLISPLTFAFRSADQKMFQESSKKRGKCEENFTKKVHMPVLNNDNNKKND